MTTTSSHMASTFDPHNVMSANVGLTVKKNGQSLRTNSSNSEAQPIVGSTVATDKEKPLSPKDLALNQALQKQNDEQDKEKDEKQINEKLENKLRELSEQMSFRKIGIKFIRHEDPDCNVVNVVDADSDETIRQIPTEEFLELSKRLDEFCDDFMKSDQTNATDDAKGKGKNQSVLFDTKI
ncbi:MAG: flagellar protein FlaG [Succinivibrionaceae bacterium]|nr:flagellar protein FlaG [Succinivibrionaceae bacterium]